jgi:hypothetical protein
VWDEQVRASASAIDPTLHLIVGNAPRQGQPLTRKENDWVTSTAQTLCRYQRLLPRSQPERACAEVRRLLIEHRRLHDLSRPLVRADHDHSLDTWCWLLRLEPAADLALQCAALLHDVERLESEADRRIEHLAPSYAHFKQKHAERGSSIVAAFLTELAFDPSVVAEAQRLVAHHERPNGDPRLQLLNDADGLSFLSLNAYGYLRYFGPEQTRRKLAFTLARLSPVAEAAARSLVHHPLLRALLAEREDCPPLPKGTSR